MKDNDQNTNLLSFGACMCLIMFILGVGIISNYTQGSFYIDTHHVSDKAGDTGSTAHLPACNTKTQPKEGDLVSASCEQKQPPKDNVPL